MITIAVADVLESSEQAMQLIYDVSQKKGIKVLSISPKDKIIYKNNKKIRLKEYIEKLRGNKETDLLLMKLNRKALEKQVYGNIKFDIAIFFDSSGNRKKFINYTGQMNHKLVESIHSNFYIIPDTYKTKKKEYITYGWSQQAHLSASSAQKGAEGDISLQCCIQNIIPSFNGELSLPREFCIQSHLDDVEGMLAGVATMLLYGINLE